MPCPHNEISIVQRSQQQSAVAAAAYQSGEKLFCEYDQQVKHYPETVSYTHLIANMSKEGKHISMDTLARICETLNCEITDVIELVPDKPTSTGGKEHERIETKNNRKRN